MHLKRSLSNPTMHSIINIFLHRHPLVYLNPTNLAPLTSSSHDLDPYPYHPVVNPIDTHKPARAFVGSINGLVCVRSIGRCDDTIDWLGIWNPSTKTVRELTTEPGFYAVAFGWDPVAFVHKVMRLCRRSGVSGRWVDVCSVPQQQQGGSCNWRSFPIDDELGGGDLLPTCTQNLIMGDGRTYCLVSRGQQSVHKGMSMTRYYGDVIACFDMVKEDLRFISIPVGTSNRKGDEDVALVNWKGELALSTRIDKLAPSFQIWKAADMDGDQCRWIKSFVIDLSDDVADVPCLVYNPPCVVYNPATSISPTQVLIFCYGQLLLFDLETKQCGQKVQMPPLAQLQACHHVQSLF